MFFCVDPLQINKCAWSFFSGWSVQKSARDVTSYYTKMRGDVSSLYTTFAKPVACTCLDVCCHMWQDNMAIRKHGITARDNAVLPGNFSIVKMPLLHDGLNINVSF